MSMIPTRHHFLFLTSSIPHLIHVVHSLNGDDLGTYDPLIPLKKITMENRTGNIDPYSYRVLTPMSTEEYTVSNDREGEIRSAETPIALTTDNERIYMYTDTSVYEVSYYRTIILYYAYTIISQYVCMCVNYIIYIIVHYQHFYYQYIHINIYTPLVGSDRRGAL